MTDKVYQLYLTINDITILKLEHLGIHIGLFFHIVLINTLRIINLLKSIYSLKSLSPRIFNENYEK